MKKIACLFVVFCIMTSQVVYAAGFSDVSCGSENYDAIVELSEKGIINGYEDGKFRPDSYISRAEAATVIVRAAELPIKASDSMYDDVPDNFWGCKYIAAATKAGIISGMGNGLFAPNNAVTYDQIIKMAVCMAGLEDEAAKNGGWPDGYAYAAYMNKIVDEELYRQIKHYEKGDMLAIRRDVAGIVYNALKVCEQRELHIGDLKLNLGMSADELDAPDEVLLSTAGFMWYVYNAETYEDFYAVGVDKNKVVALASAGLGFEYRGYSAGDIMPQDESFQNYLYEDSNDGNKVHGVLILNNEYEMSYKILFENYISSSEAEFSGESKMNFHFTNAFRVWHGESILRWSDKAAKSAKFHSQDMADFDYFSHTNLDGISSSQRMLIQGIDWMSCGENIAAGTLRFLGFHSYNGWVNSAGHRANMLNDYDYLGVGIHFNPDSQYGYYHTQNFYK